MRPHRLTLTAFGAFAGTEQVTFDDLEGLFLLHGETGAGKTTLLDAIAFALYGRVPGERGQAKRLRSDHAAPGTPTEVELEATIGGRRLRITRKPEQERPSRRGTGTTREQASVRVDERTASGTWENKSIRVAEADEEIKNLMGMSAEQFFQVVLLPQGQFAQFLHAKAQEKEALLQKLFGTDRFRKAEDWLAERKRATEKEVQAAADGVSRLVAQVAQAAGTAVPDSPPPAPELPSAVPWQATWAASLTAAAAAARGEAAVRVEARKRALEEALAAKTAAEQLQLRQRRRRDTERRKRELLAMAAEIAALRAEADQASRAAEVAAVLAAADRAAAAVVTAQGAEAQARAAIPGHSPVPGDSEPHILSAAAEAQQQRFGTLDALRALADQASEEDKTAAAARGRAAARDADRQLAMAEAERRRMTRPRAEEARDAARQAAADLPAVQSAAETARQVTVDAAALVTERGKAESLREAHLTAREKAADLREAANDLHRRRIDGMSAELAASLFPGYECPVCGATEHPNPKAATFPPVSRDQEEEADKLANEAIAASERVGREFAAAGQAAADLTRRLAGVGFTVPASAAELATASRQAKGNAERLAAQAARLAAQAATTAELDRQLAALDKSIADDNASVEKLAEQRTAALAEAEAAQRRAAARRAELRSHLGDAADLDTALTATRQLAESLAGAADAAEAAARAAGDAREAAERAASAVTEVGFADIAAARSALRDDGWRSASAKRVKGYDAEAEAVATLLADPDLADVELDPPAPVAEATEAAGQAHRDHDLATSEYATASHTASQLAALQPKLDAALADLGPRQARAEQIRHLADLAAGLGTANQYKMTLSSFVLAARLEEVAHAASDRLRTMTAGRYSLVHSDAKKGNQKAGLSLLAQDTWTGQDRDTATLSGGETFLASLALALGLADVVTAESAGSPMEALFVDEGFGTLDEETLDEVMTVLDTLRAGGRLVGIVSHVAELRQRIPAQIQVRKSRHGSHVEVTAA